MSSPASSSSRMFDIEKDWSGLEPIEEQRGAVSEDAKEASIIEDHRSSTSSSDNDVGPGSGSDGLRPENMATNPEGILSPVISRVTSRSSVSQAPPPDGGWAAWTVGKNHQLWWRDARIACRNHC
jgi:hypothetical protein